MPCSMPHPQSRPPPHPPPDPFPSPSRPVPGELPVLTAHRPLFTARRSSHALGFAWTAQTGHKSVRPVFWVRRFSDFVGLGKLFTNLKIPSAFLKPECLSECSACAGACVLRLFDCCITPSSSNSPNRVNSGILGWFWAVVWGRAVITRTPRPWSHAQRSAHTPASTGPRPAAAPCHRPSTPDPPQPAIETAP